MSDTDFFAEEVKKETKTEHEKCPNCGNNLKFNPKTQKLFCEYCDTSVDFTQNSNYRELDIRTAFVTEMNSWDDSAKVFACANCGAQVVLEKTETASSCPFCGTPHVLPTKEHAGLKPNVVVPFCVDKESAVDNLKKWARRKFFAPRKFKKTFLPEKLSGVYMPCFTFDTDTSSTYDGKIGIHRTRTVGSGKNRRTETWTEWRYIRGTFNRFFDDITITAASKLDQKSLDKLGGYSSTNNRVYDDSYLFGFMAYRNERSVEDCWQEARQDVDSILRREILSQYRHDVVAYLNVGTVHQGVTYKYSLLPVYVGNYKYGKKIYNFVSNGVTGVSTGKYPLSPIRVGGFVGFLAALAVGIAMLIMYL